MSTSDSQIAAWKERRAILSQHLEMLESDATQTGTNALDPTTTHDVTRMRSWIAELDLQIAGRSRWIGPAAPKPVYAIEQAMKLSKRSTMVAFVVAAFQNHGGRARLSQIYPEVRRLLHEHGRHIDDPDVGVRTRIYNFCPQRATYLGPTIFRLCGWGEYRLELRIPFSEIPISLWEEERHDRPADGCTG